MSDTTSPRRRRPLDDLRHGVGATARGLGRVLHLDKNETLGIVGESGSGKTVLARTIMGLQPRANVEVTGSVLLNGHQMVGVSEDEKRKILGHRSRHGLPGPDDLAQPGDARRAPDRRGAARAPRDVQGRRQGPRDRAARARGHPLARAALPRVPGPALGRHAPARRHRHRAGLLAPAADGRRADDRAWTSRSRRRSSTCSTTCKERLHMSVDPHHPRPGRRGDADVAHHRHVRRARSSRPGSTRDVFYRHRMPYTRALLESSPKVSSPTHTRLTRHPRAARPTSCSSRPAAPSPPRCGYATERCHTERPELEAAGEPGHAFACWNPLPANRGASRDRRPHSLLESATSRSPSATATTR